MDFNFDKRNWPVLAVLLIAIISIASVIYFQQSSVYKKVLAQNEALLIINRGQGKERWFKGEVLDDMTVKNALEAASLAGGFHFKANARLVEVDGIVSNDKKKWRCYLNNEEIKEELDKKVISAGDKIFCVYK
jgi:hypothetical protein